MIGRSGSSAAPPEASGASGSRAVMFTQVRPPSRVRQTALGTIAPYTVSNTPPWVTTKVMSGSVGWGTILTIATPSKAGAPPLFGPLMSFQVVPPSVDLSSPRPA